MPQTPAATAPELTARGYQLILRTTGLDSDQGPTATEDNLLKGAAAQAVQCANIRFGYAETQSLI